MFGHTLRSLWSRKRRLLGAGVAIIIGVAFLTATMVVGDGMRGGIHDLFAEGNSGTDVLVRSELPFGSIDERLVDELAEAPGVADAAPLVDGLAQIVGADGEAVGGDGPPTLGSNWIDGDRFPYVITDGRPPASADEVVIDTGAADLADLAVGDVTTVRVPHAETVTVVGLAELGSGESLGGLTFAWFETDIAQELLLGDDSQVTAVNLTTADGVAPDQLLATIEAQLPAGLEAVTGDTLTAEDDADIAADFLDAFEMFLLVFAGIALLVATFSIHNTLSILVAQRTRESALLRAIGASRRQIVGSVTLEALLLGVVASLVGLAAGIGLAHGLMALMDAVGVGVPTSGLGAGAATVATVLAVGVGVTLIAGITPALKASKVAPVAALRDAEIDGAIDGSDASRSRAVVGALVLTAGVATIVTATATPDGALAQAGLGALVILVGMVAVGPAVARPASRVIGVPVRLLGGTSGRLATRNAMRNPRRSAGTATALMIGTAVVALFATFAVSLTSTLDELIDEFFDGDLVVEQEAFSGSGLSPEMAVEMDGLPEVDTATGLAFAHVLLDGEEAQPFAVDAAALAPMVDLGATDGSLADLGEDGLAVSADYAEGRGWSLGSAVEVTYVDGATVLLTVQTIYENDNVLSDVLIDRDAWSPHTGRGDDFIVMIELAEGISVEDGRTAVDAVAAAYGAPVAENQDEYLESSTEDVAQMLNVVYGLLGLAILIALIGIANTLSLSLYERTRELGLLRAVGQTRAQLRRTVRWESVILAVFGTIGGLALGTFVGWGVMRAFEASEGIGVFTPPITTLVVVLVVAIVAGVVAAWRPARRAARLDVLAAISSD